MLNPSICAVEFPLQKVRRRALGRLLMPQIVDIEEFLSLRTTLPIIDVRSPGEFTHGHIPGANSVPAFSDDERAQIGTLYKKKGQAPAIVLGEQLVAPKLEGFRNRIKALSVDSKILVHCWRGGLRSMKMAAYFEEAGVTAQVLEGGYKTYRRHILNSFGNKLNICLIDGETGSGKTDILKALALKGEQVIDLEEIASHRGSSFGAIGMAPQPTVENFENRLYEVMKNIDPGKRVWVEAESRSIGRVFIPELFWNQMHEAKVFRLQLPFEVRVQRLVEDYGKFPIEILLEALDRIKKRLGGLDHKNATEALERGDIAEFIRFALRYYDKAYRHSHDERNYSDVRMCECTDGDPKLNANRLLQLLN